MAYGLRLTLRHARSLIPGSALFYLPELLAEFGRTFPGGRAAATGFKFAVGCWLLWHALRLSDLETRASRLHEATLPAPGYLGRFLASTLLFWGGLGLGLWPCLRIVSGAWIPRGGLDGLARPLSLGRGDWPRLALGALAALPAGLWSVYGWFHGYYVADEGQGAWASMLSSFRAVRGAFWECAVFLVVIGLINAAGLELWVVGVFFAFPVTLMATTYVHLRLKRGRGGPVLGSTI